MKKFSIFRHPLKRIEAVKEGFSWPAFFIPVFWCFYHRMWKEGLLLLGAYTLSNMISSRSYDEGLLIANVVATIALWIWFPFAANRLRAQRLISRGYKKVGFIEAANPDAALAAFVEPPKAS